MKKKIAPNRKVSARTGLGRAPLRSFRKWFGGVMGVNYNGIKVPVDTIESSASTIQPRDSKILCEYPFCKYILHIFVMKQLNSQWGRGYYFLLDYMYIK